MRSTLPRHMLEFHATLALQTRILLKRFGHDAHDITFSGSYGFNLEEWNACLTIEFNREHMSMKFLNELRDHFKAKDVMWAPISHIRSHPNWVEVHGWSVVLCEVDKSLYEHRKPAPKPDESERGNSSERETNTDY